MKKNIDKFIKNYDDNLLDTDKIHGGSASGLDSVIIKDVRRGSTEVTVFS